MGGGFLREVFGDDGGDTGDLGSGLGVVDLDGPGLLELAFQLLLLGLGLGGYDVEVTAGVGADVGFLAGVFLFNLRSRPGFGLDALGQVGAGDVHQLAVGHRPADLLLLGLGGDSGEGTQWSYLEAAALELGGHGRVQHEGAAQEVAWALGGRFDKYMLIKVIKFPVFRLTEEPR